MNEELEPRMEELRAALRENGLRLTVQRREVFRELAENVEHLDAETVYQRVKERIPMISRDTVYRTLSMLEEQGLLSRVNLLTERARFDPVTKDHPHFICTACGKVEDLSSELIDRVEVPDDARSHGDVNSVHVNFRGVCSECLQSSGDQE